MEKLGKYIWIQNIHNQYETFPEITNDVYKVEVDTNDPSQKDILSIDKTKEYLEVCPSCLKGVNNLQHLEEQSINSITHNLRIRFFEQKFYTFLDKSILLSVNPGDSSEIVDKEYIKIYRNFFNKKNPNPEPHLFYIAESAYQNFLKDDCNQSILLSGESGAGKTQLTKTLLKYFSFMNLKSLNEDSANMALELLETFGNARTANNKNSSRFAKFIKIIFNSGDENNFNKNIVSYEFNNFLLETNRLVKLEETEFNFNIFYQILETLDIKEKKRFFIDENTIESFNYLNQNTSIGAISKKISYKEIAEVKFSKTKNLLKFFNFKDKEIESILSIIIGILFIGNIEYEEVFINGSTVSDVNLNEPNLINASHLLGIERKDFRIFLTRNKNEKNLSIESAIVKRDNLSKNLYLLLFNWITNKINFYFAQNFPTSENLNSTSKSKTHQRFIGILDNFGYESHQISNFDQLCVNYANEKFQKFFNDNIFIEQEEYLKEKLEWNKTNYFENDLIIDLIEKDAIGILSMLNSDSNYNNTNFRNELHNNFNDKNNYLGDSVDGFILIHHSTGDVIYDVNNLIENSNNVSSTWREFQPFYELLQSLDQSESDKTQFNIGKQFSDILRILNKSKNYFIKCIKPNPLQNSNFFNFFEVGEQLLCANVVDALKIKTYGYPVVYSFFEFYKKFQNLAPEINLLDYRYEYENVIENVSWIDCIDYRQLVKAIIQNIFFKYKNDSHSFEFFSEKFLQIGDTKIFMKKELKIFMKEKLPYANNILMIQKYTRRFLTIKNFERLVMKTIIIQNSFRHYKFKQFISGKIKNLIRMSKDLDENKLELDQSKINMKNDYYSFNLNVSGAENLDISSHSDINSISDKTAGIETNVKDLIQQEELKEKMKKVPLLVEIDLIHDKEFLGDSKNSKNQKSAQSNNSLNSRISKNSKISKFSNYSDISKNSKISKYSKNSKISNYIEMRKNSNKNLETEKKNLNLDFNIINTDAISNINILPTEAESNQQAINIFDQLDEILKPNTNFNQINLNPNSTQDLNFKNLNLSQSPMEQINSEIGIFATFNQNQGISNLEANTKIANYKFNQDLDILQNLDLNYNLELKPKNLKENVKVTTLKENLNPISILDENLNQSLIENLTQNLYPKKSQTPNRMKRKKNSSLNDLSLNNMIGSEYISKIEKLKEEIKLLKEEKETFNEKVKTLESKKDKEIELLNEKLKHLKNVIINCEQEIKELNEKNFNTNELASFKTNPLTENEIEKLREENLILKKFLNENESQLEILKMNQTNLKKSNEELSKINDDYKEQLLKRKEKEENEVNSLLLLIHNLQKDKIDLETKLMESISKLQYNSNSGNSKYDNSDMFSEKEKNPSEISANYKRIISNLKNENKNLNSQIEKIRFDSQIEIIKISTEIKESKENFEKVSKEFAKLESEANILRKENSDLSNSNRQMKDILEKMQSKLNFSEKNSNRFTKNLAQMEEALKNKEIEVRELKSRYETNLQLLERTKNMETALKEELCLKENDLEKRKEIIKEFQNQIETYNEENLKLKKENIQIKSKLELKEIEITTKYENNLKLKNEENLILKNKIGIYEKYVPEFKKEIEKKRMRIKKNKKMNNLLIELLKVKKNQMQCMEALHITNSLNIKDNLRKYENDEKNLLEEVQEISNALEDSEDEDEEEEEIYEDDMQVGVVNKKSK